MFTILLPIRFLLHSDILIYYLAFFIKTVTSLNINYSLHLLLFTSNILHYIPSFARTLQSSPIVMKTSADLHLGSS